MGVMQPDQITNALVSNEARRARWVVADDLTRTLAAYENVLEITNVASDGTLTMPDVAQAAGQMYFLRAVSFTSTTPTVTLSFPGNPNLYMLPTTAVAAADTWASSNTLTATDDYLLLYSNGVAWFVLGNVTT